MSQLLSQLLSCFLFLHPLPAVVASASSCTEQLRLENTEKEVSDGREVWPLPSSTWKRWLDRKSAAQWVGLAAPTAPVNLHSGANGGHVPCRVCRKGQWAPSQTAVTSAVCCRPGKPGSCRTWFLSRQVFADPHFPLVRSWGVIFWMSPLWR